jgi:membrane protein implicated in regulation of membrane protease activity
MDWLTEPWLLWLLAAGVFVAVKEIKPGIDGRVSFRGSFWPAQAEQHFNVDDTVLVVGYAAGIKTILKVVKPDQGESA